MSTIDQLLHEIEAAIENFDIIHLMNLERQLAALIGWEEANRQVMRLFEAWLELREVEIKQRAL